MSSFSQMALCPTLNLRRWEKKVDGFKVGTVFGLGKNYRTDLIGEKRIKAAWGHRRSVDENKREWLRQKFIFPPKRWSTLMSFLSLIFLLQFPFELFFPHYKTSKNHCTWVRKPGHYVFVTLSGEKLVQSSKQFLIELIIHVRLR